MKKNQLTPYLPSDLNGAREQLETKKGGLMSVKEILKKTLTSLPATRRIKRCMDMLEVSRAFKYLINPISAHPMHHDFLPRICNHIIGSKKFLFCDIGANFGSFIRTVFKSCPQVDYWAFEPQKSCLDVLRNYENRFNNLKVFPYGLGDQDCTLTFFEQKNPGLSSFKLISENYSYGEKGEGGEVDSYEIEVRTLDQLLAGVTYENIFLKIDVQGFEEEVFKGATKILESGRVKGVLVELSTCEKYKGQTTYIKLITLLEEYGFILYDILHGHREFPTEMLTEMDAVFVAKDYVNDLM